MRAKTYLNFDLLIMRSYRGYVARVIASPAGQATVDFTSPLSDIELDTFFSPGDNPVRSGTGVPAAAAVPASPDAQQLGAQLFNAVFAQDVGKCLLLSFNLAKERHANLRIRLRLDKEVPELAELPWEFLYAPDWHRFPALSEETPIVRYVELLRSEEPLRVKLPLNILAVVASPKDLPALDVEHEWERLQHSIQDLATSGAVKCERLAQGTLNALQDYLRKEDVHILHFIGHGFFDLQSQHNGLVLNDEAGNSHFVTAPELAALLSDHKALRLIFLNACEGARSGREDFFAGVAQTLVQQGMPAVIAMQFPVTDRAAQALAQTFYKAIADGLPADAALTEARKAIYSQGNLFEWATPVFFSRSEDNSLFDIEDTRPLPPCPYPGMVPFSEKQSTSFFGRTREIQAAVERLRLHPFLTVIGPSGSGKSSLVFAGVLPALRLAQRFGASERTFIELRPGDKPLLTLTQKLGFATVDECRSATFTQPTFLVIDQFEETFTLQRSGISLESADASTPSGQPPPPPEGLLFQQTLAQLISKANLFLLLTVRADFYPELMASPLWPQIQANRLELTSMGAEELRQAIVQPAEGVGITVESDLVERLVAEAAGEPGVLPLVQETLVLLWEQLARRRLTLSAYQAISEPGRTGLQVAIARRADVTYKNLPSAGQVIARRIFLRLVQFGEGRSDTRRQLTVDDLVDSTDDPLVFEQTLQQVTGTRLLTLSAADGQQSNPGKRRVDISHEALIIGWPLLRTWLQQRREAEQVRRRLEDKAKEWDWLGRAEGGLLDQYELREADQWFAASGNEELGSSKTLQALVELSRVTLLKAQQEKERVQQEREAAQQREVEQAKAIAEQAKVLAEKQTALVDKQTEARNRLRWLVVTLTALLMLALLGGLWIRSQASLLSASNKALTGKTLALNESNQTLHNKQQELTVALAESESQKTIAQAETHKAEAAAHQAAANGYAAQVQTLLSRDRVASSQALDLARQAVTATLDTDGYVSGDADLSLRQAVDTVAFRSTLPLYRHVGAILALAISPDDRLVASASEDGSIRLWDFATGAHVRALNGHSRRAVTALAFNEDGSLLASAGQDNTVCIWRVATGELLLRVTLHQHTVNTVVFSPDGQTAVSGDDDGKVYLWKTNNGALVHTFAEHNGAVRSARFDPKGAWVVTAGDDKIVRIWDVQTGALRTRLPKADGQIWALALSPDGATLAGAGKQPVVWLWNLATHELNATLHDHEHPIHALAFSHDGQWLASTDEDGKVDLWTVKTRTLVRSLSGNEESKETVYSVGFSHDDKIVISGGDHRALRWWNVSTGEMTLMTPNHVDAILNAVFNSDGSLVASGSKDYTVRIWDVATGSTVKLLQPQHRSIEGLAFQPNTALLAVGGADGIISLWNIVTDRVVLTFTGHTKNVISLAYRKDGARLVSGSADGAVRIWDTTTGQTLQTIQADPERVRAVAFSPSGASVASTGKDSLIHVWDAETGASLYTLQGHTGEVYSVVFSPNDKLLASGGDDRTVRIWSTETRTLLRTFQGHTGKIRSVAFSPDNLWVASTGDDRTIRLWNVATGEAIRTVRGHTDVVRSVAFSPNGDMLVSASGGETGNNSIRVWNAKTLGDRSVLRGHQDIVRWAMYSPDGQWIASACDDHRIRIWNAATGDLVQTLEGHQDRIRTVAFSHDSRRLVSASDDKTVRIWDVKTWQTMLTLKEHTGWVRSAFFSPDDTLIVSASEDKTVRLWNAATGAPVWTSPKQDGVVVFATFSPDGAQIASAAFDNSVRLWNTKNGALLHTFITLSKFNNMVTFRADGKLLAVGEGDADQFNLVQFWDLSTYQEARPPLQHQGPVRGLAFTHDGWQLLTAGHGNPVQLWDLRTNQVFRTFKEHEKSVWSVAFSPDDRFFVTASEDATVRIWFTSLKDLLYLVNRLLQPDPPSFMTEQRTTLVEPASVH